MSEHISANSPSHPVEAISPEQESSQKRPKKREKRRKRRPSHHTVRRQHIAWLQENRGTSFIHSDYNTAKSVLCFPCPVGSCGTPLYLLCPHCRKGELFCDEEALHLTCKRCHSTVHHVTCAHGHPVHMPYIAEKQKTWRHVTARSDGSFFGAILGIFAVFGLIAWLMIGVLGAFY